MDIGVVLQTTPPAARVIDLAKKAEMYGMTHVWTFDSHILWEEPYVIYSQILAQTNTYATLNEMYGNRTVCGIGRGDSAVRVTNGKPTTLATLRESIHVIRELANGRGVEYNGSTIRFPWASKSRCEVWVAAYGPKALQLTGEVGDGFILQLADLSIAEWTIGAVRKAAKDAGRDPKSGTDLAHMRDQCRWFGGMVGNHVADIVARYGENSAVPKALTDYIKGREGYDYNEHGRAGNSHTTFVPDEIVDRFCILGGPDDHIRRLKELEALGVDQFAIYLQHDGKDQTLEAYGERIMPAIAELARAKQ
jgi:probable F420-dependent oxidoreductase